MMLVLQARNDTSLNVHQQQRQMWKDLGSLSAFPSDKDQQLHVAEDFSFAL
jgi:hypothetical protein